MHQSPCHEMSLRRRRSQRIEQVLVQLVTFNCFINER